MHVQSCTFNFLFKFRNSIEFYGFLGEGRGGLHWHESTRSVYIEMLEVISNQYDTSIWHVDMYLLAWRSFSKLGSFIECSLKSLKSAFIIDNLVVNYYAWCNLYFQVINFDEYCFIFFLTSTDENPWC
jgi:hypothetical protein